MRPNQPPQQARQLIPQTSINRQHQTSKHQLNFQPNLQRFDEMRFYATPNFNTNRAPSMQPYNPYGNQRNDTQENMNVADNSMAQYKKLSLDNMMNEAYKPAKYHLALEYRFSRSYMNKIGPGQYQQLKIFCDTKQLRKFGMGPYFYIQFFRRIMWLLLIMSLLHVIAIIINYKGTGMDSYSASFSTYLIRSTLGNYTGNSLTQFDIYLTVFVPFASYLALFIFYLIWKKHYHKVIDKQDQANADVRPENFCVQFNGLDQGYVNESELHQFMQVYGPVYEVSLNRRHKNKLIYFQELDQLEEQIKQQQLELKLGNGSQKSVEKLLVQKKVLEQQIHGMQTFVPQTVSAYVHFQHENTKQKCLQFNNQHYLYDTCGHCCMRNCCCCCIDPPAQQYKFKGKPLYIKNQTVPTPQDINWQSFQLGFCNRFCRALFVFLIIVLFLAISCAIIGLCTVYISSKSSNCQGIDTSTYTAITIRSVTDTNTVRCYCNANYIQSLTDNDIKQSCSSYLADIYVQQAIQYVVIIVAALTNFLFGLTVDKLVNCVRPISLSSALMTKTGIYSSFLIINTILLPILIYANIFGFSAGRYLSFITIISQDIKAFFSVDKITLYSEYSQVWYRNVSPIFTNFIILDSIVLVVMFIVNKCRAGVGSLEDQEGKILQKHMNQKITSFKLDVYKQAASFYMIFFMTCLFYVAIPILLPLAWVNIGLRYVFNRSLLQKNSTRIDGLGQQFNSLTLILLPVILILCPLNGEWMLISNSYIYPNAWNISLKYLYGAFDILDKQLYIPFYLALSLAALAEFLVYNTLGKFCACICSVCCPLQEKTFHTRPFTQYTKNMNVVCSYNIKNNDKLKNAVLNMEKYLVDKGIA